jgi:hypothetical protein
VKTSPNSFDLFSDINNNKQFDSGVDQIERTIALRPDYRIYALCADAPGLTGAAGLCGGVGPSFKEFNFIEVVFTRPNPDASMRGERATNGVIWTTISPIRIAIRSDNGTAQRSIEVWPTGQISVK